MRYVLLCVAICFAVTSIGQFRHDNVLYKTVYIEDLCAGIKSNPNALLLDVRSKGEFEDTSVSNGLNIGRLKNAMNLDVNELPKRWKELLPYKDQPVYVMCSHSQRSRRASKMLADSGFTNVINVNGGLTSYNLYSFSPATCKDNLYQTGNAYTLVSPLALCDFLFNNKDAFILDVRSDSAYRGISSVERQNATGRLTGAVNIPLNKLKEAGAQIPTNKTILIVDDFGNESPQAARHLLANGYKNVHVLFNGMDMLMSRDRAEIGCAAKAVVTAVPYKTLSASELEALLKKEKSVTIIDVRPAEEFNNQAKQVFRNIGHIRNAVNIEGRSFQEHLAELGSDKSKPIVLYHFSGNAPETFAAAKQLADNGFKRVYVLAGGYFNLRWQAANLKGRSSLKDLAVDVPADNL